MTAEVQIGDVGTTYRVRCLDAGVPFDPTTASVKQIIFKMGGLLATAVPVATVTKTATVQVGTGTEAGQFYLVYVVTATDVSTNGFHSTAGRVQIQANVEYADGSKYHSDVQDVNEAGQPLGVKANLT